MVDLPAVVRVLLVDDEPSVRRAATRLLESLGGTVTSVEHGADAVRLLETRPDAFDLLVTDYRMPGMTGAELIAVVEGIAERLPIVLISGHLEGARSDAPLPERVVLLAKPFSRHSLGQAVATALNGLPSVT